MVEQRTFNPWVQGSSPWRPTDFVIVRTTPFGAVSAGRVACGPIRPQAQGKMPQKLTQHFQRDAELEAEVGAWPGLELLFAAFPVADRGAINTQRLGPDGTVCVGR